MTATKLESAVLSLTEEMLASEDFKEIVKATIDKRMKDAVENAFGYNTDLRKGIDDMVQKALAINLSKVTLPEYSVFLTEQVKAISLKHFKEAANTHLIEELNTMFESAPKEITTQELVDIMLESKREEWRECPCGDDDEPSISITQSSWGGITLKLWCGQRYSQLSSTQRELDPDFHLYFSNNKIGIIHGGKMNFATANFGENAKIYQMYAAGTIITDIEDVDEDDICTAIHEEY